ncbi:MAG TPA: tetratricopeptide repeat protein, partial [Waterburya sp.]
MRLPLKFLSLVSATVLLSLSSPLPPTGTTLEIARVLAQAPTTQERQAEADGLFRKGVEFFSRTQFREALQTYQQVLRIRQELGDKVGEGITLNNIGTVYLYQGEYATALEFYQQGLDIHKQVGNKAEEGTTLNNIGTVYLYQGEYSKALEFYQQALALHKQVGNEAMEGTTLNNMGEVYRNLGEYSKALEFYQQALALHKQVGNKAMEGTTFNNIGLVYLNQGEYDKALEFYQQALALHKQVGNKEGQGITLSSIGYLLAQQNQPELAIVFYKQSVNVREAIRQDIRGLPPGEQASYTKTVAGTYRQLANLLLKQNRVLEAQQVLDLLKVQEVRNYLGNLPNTNQAARDVNLLSTEQRVGTQYSAIQDKVIALGQELTALRNIPEAKRTPAQQQRIAELVKNEETIRQEFNSFMKSPAVAALTQQLKTTG